MPTPVLVRKGILINMFIYFGKQAKPETEAGDPKIIFSR